MSRAFIRKMRAVLTVLALALTLAGGSLSVSAYTGAAGMGDAVYRGEQGGIVRLRSKKKKKKKNKNKNNNQNNQSSSTNNQNSSQSGQDKSGEEDTWDVIAEGASSLIAALFGDDEAGEAAGGTDDENTGEAGDDLLGGLLGGLLIEEDGEYTSKDEVALYIHTYGRLPSNYITKREAEELGWVSSWGNLWEVAPGKSIGGSRFGNYEGNLPESSGRKYYECDIDFDGEYRNAKRIIYSNDGLIFYTDDHYKTFEQLY